MIAAQRKIMIRSFGAIQNLNAMTALRGRMSSILLKQQLKPSSLESCFTPVMMQPTAANGSRVLQVRGFRRPPPQGKKFQEDSEVWVRQRNLKQSPLKMKFLVMLIRKAWIPDALAQLKFSPKHRATDLSAMIKRGCAIARLNFGALPSELMVEEVIVTKGLAQKRMTIMGRGHTGFGYTRSSHVNIRLKKVDFEAMAAQAKSPWEAAQWRKWKRIADNQRQAQEAQQTGVVSAAANA